MKWKTESVCSSTFLPCCFKPVDVRNEDVTQKAINPEVDSIYSLLFFLARSFTTAADTFSIKIPETKQPAPRNIISDHT